MNRKIEKFFLDKTKKNIYNLMHIRFGGEFFMNFIKNTLNKVMYEFTPPPDKFLSI